MPSLISTKPPSPDGTVQRLLGAGQPGVVKLELQPVDGHSLPVVVITGHAKGPRVCVTAGIHGSEYCAIEAAQRILAISPFDLAGTLVVLPLINGEAFRQRRVYLNPADGKNLNRVFPGNPEGSPSERLADWLLTEVVAHMDALVDLHCGDLSESLTPFTIFCDGDDRSEKLARAFGLPCAIRNRASGMLIAGAAGIGVPAIIAEAGGAGRYEEAAIDLLVGGLHRLFHALGLLQRVESAEIAEPRSVAVLQCESIVSGQSGLWYPSYAAGDAVSSGSPMGYIRNPYGEIVCPVIAPIAGKIMFQISSLAVNSGETIAWIGAS